ncbi:hypothetical protein Patl1_03752 [Pistacia atlantica]|uniref:Uncharacterized protein n=1 Tax=Pistacia atlantica TaxID=434234 RepID=A0ACC1BS10_9ROSI|nr:hypothetical protein Patl1_03752 [Pistacia atlantica]
MLLAMVYFFGGGGGLSDGPAGSSGLSDGPAGSGGLSDGPAGGGLGGGVLGCGRGRALALALALAVGSHVLEGVSFPPVLPDYVEPGKVKVTTLNNGIRIASATSAVCVSYSNALFYSNPNCHLEAIYSLVFIWLFAILKSGLPLAGEDAFKGTKNRSHLHIVRKVEEIGGNISASASREPVEYTFDALKTYVPEMVELLVVVTERLCLGGFCYKNYKFASFRFEKRVSQKLEVVSELKEKGREFKEVADQRKDDPMDDQIPSELTVGLE